MALRFLPASPYKGIFALLLLFIALEYFFNTVSDTKKTLFFNNTKYVHQGKDSHTYGPILKALLSKNKSNTAIFNNTKMEWYFPKSSGLNYIVSHPPLIYNITNITGVANLFDVTSLESDNALNMTKVTFNDVPLCPEVSQYLYGKVTIQRSPVPNVKELETKFSWLKPGGHWAPTSCRVLKKVAIIIPFRCRGEHLLIFLNHMHPFLRRQQLDYTIFVIEQDGNTAFNRATLMNIGYAEALKRDDFDCFVFHDVDLLPEDDRNLYTCPDQPRHMSVAVDIFKYKLPYPAIFGGVSAISREHFQILNGFSNSFWGWGGEDDDMSNRIRYHHLHISRYPLPIARYTMLTHKKDKPSPNRYDMLKQGQKRFDNDGLNSLTYKLVQTKDNLLYTWILVALDQPKMR